jgi:hypothetical protein
MQHDPSAEWPSGLAGYDRLMARGDQKRGIDNRREREAIQPCIAADERVIGRHFAAPVTIGDQTEPLHKEAVILSTDSKLLMLSARGIFRPQFRIDTFNYADLKPGVGKVDDSIPGLPLWFSGFGTLAGVTYILRFFTEQERDAFVSDVGGALGGWHIIHGTG